MALAVRGQKPHNHTEPQNSAEEQQFYNEGIRRSTVEHSHAIVPQSGQSMTAAGGGAIQTYQVSGAAAGQHWSQLGVKPQYNDVETAFSDPAVRKILSTNKNTQGVDKKYIESVDLMRKLQFAQALGGRIAATMTLDPGVAQPDWGPMIEKAGLLFRKANNNRWEPGVFFIYNGYLACCEIYPGGAQRVEMKTLNLEVGLPGGDPKPLPLKGCEIFAGKDVREFQVHIMIPHSEGRVKAIDLAAETPDVREQWIEEIFAAAGIGDSYGQRQAYIPKKHRGKAPVELKALSSAKMTLEDRGAGAASGSGVGGPANLARSCGNDTGGCTMM